MRGASVSTVVVPLLLLSLAATGLVGGCVTTESRVRVITRAPLLRSPADLPSSLATPIAVDVGVDAATDAELVVVADHLQQRLTQTASSTSAGAVTVVRAKLRAAPGREQHRYVATCRLRLQAGDDVIGEVEAETTRLVRARNLSVIELDGIKEEMVKNGGRIPLLQADDVEAALADACDAAFFAIAFDIRPEDAVVDAEHGDGFNRAERRLEREDRRRRALEKLQTAKSTDEAAGALVDLGDVGDVKDAERVAGHLYADSALVRRAAESSFTVLCAGQPKILPPCRKPAPPDPPAEEQPKVIINVDEAAEDAEPVRGSQTPVDPATPTPTTTDPASPTPTTTTDPATPATTTTDPATAPAPAPTTATTPTATTPAAP